MRSLSLLMLAVAATAACTTTVTRTSGGDLPPWSPAFRQEVERQPETREAAAALDRGDCRTAIPLLTIYLSQKQETGPVDYLLGRAYLCIGENLKGAHHLKKALAENPEFEAEPRAAARFFLARLAADLEAARQLSFEDLKAVHLLASLGDATWHADAVDRLLERYALRLLERGDFAEALAVAETMARTGGPAKVTFPLQARALCWLGETARLLELADQVTPSLGPDAAELLYQAAEVAEAAFRQETAAALYERSLAAGCTRASLHLDLARVLLKDQQLDAAQAHIQTYLQAATEEETVPRTLSVAALLEKYLHIKEGAALIKAAIDRCKTEFSLYRALARIEDRAPGTVDVPRLFSDYIAAAGGSREALSQVGDTLVEWRRPDTLAAVFTPLAGSPHKDLVAFYLGTAARLKDDVKAAERLFDDAISAAADPGAMLDRIAQLLGDLGHKEEAFTYFEKALAREPLQVPVLLKLATLREEQAIGEGVKLIERRTEKETLTAASLILIGTWCEEHGFPGRAMEAANRACQLATGPELSAAEMFRGRLLLRAGQAAAAARSLRTAFENAASRTAAAQEIFRLCQDVRAVEVACLLPDVTAWLAQNDPDALAWPLLHSAVMASMTCGRPDVDLYRRFIAGDRDPAAALSLLITQASTPEIAEAVVALAEEQPEPVRSAPEVAAALARYFAARGDCGRVLVQVRAYAPRTIEPPAIMGATARALLMQGCADAAREVLLTAWTRGSDQDRLEQGLLLASLLLLARQEAQALPVIDTLTRIPGCPPDTTVAAASLLIEAGRLDLAEQVLLDALRRPLARPTPPEALGPGEEEPPADEALPLWEVMGAEPEEDPRTMLVARLAQVWEAEGKAWPAFVETVLPLVEGWHGEQFLAQTLMEHGAAAQGVELFRTAWKKSPGDLPLAEALIDALLYKTWQDGLKPAAADAKVDEVAAGFVSARGSDPDAMGEISRVLIGKGLFAAAARLLSPAARVDKLDADNLFLLAVAQVGLGHVDQSRELFFKAALGSGCDARRLRTIRDELSRVNREDIALDVLSACATRYPKVARIHLMVAQTVLSAFPPAERPRAVEAVKKAVNADPDVAGEAVRTLINYDLFADAEPLLEEILRTGEAEDVIDALGLAFSVLGPAGDLERMNRLAALAWKTRADDARLAFDMSDLFLDYHLEAAGLEKLKFAAEHGVPEATLLLGLRLLSHHEEEKGLALIREYLEGKSPAAAPPKTDGGKTPPLPVPPKKLWNNEALDAYMADKRVADSLLLAIDFLTDAGLPEPAAEVIALGLKRYPDDPEFLLRALRASLARGRPVAATETLVSLCSLPDPGLQAQLQAALNILRSQGQLDTAVAALLPAVEAGKVGCLPLLLSAYVAAGRSADAAALAHRLALDSRVDADALLNAAELLLARSLFGPAEELLLAAHAGRLANAGTFGRTHLLLCRLYSATHRRDRVRDMTKLLLLQAGDDAALRTQIAENLATWEYVDEALEQYRILEALRPASLDDSTRIFELLLLRQDQDAARQVALRASYRSSSLFNSLLTFAGTARSRMAFELSLELYAICLEIDPTNQPLLYAVAELELITDHPTRGLALLERYIGKGLGAEGRRAEAVGTVARYNYLGAATTLAGKTPAPAARLALSLELARAGREQEAAWLAAAALEAMPDPAQAARDLLYDYVGRPARLPAATRLSALKLACPPDAAVPVCAFWAGQAALEQGKLPDALAAFGRQLVGSGETWRLTLAAFSALVRFGFAAQAEQLLAEVMPGYRKSDVLEEGVSTLLKLLQEPGLTQAGKDAARTVGQHYIAQLLGADPFDYWHRAQAAEIEFVTGSPDKAIEMYEQAIADTPWEAGLYNNLAYLLSRVNRDLTHGLELAATAIALEPANNVFYLDTRGWLLYRAGRLDEAYDLIAASLFRGQLGLGYTMAECSIHLGTVELARNHKPEAIAWFRLAAALDRDGDQGRTAVEELRKLGEDPFRME